jgi:integrase
MKPIKGATAFTVQQLTEASQSDATRRSYAQALRHFFAHGGQVPCNPETVAAYIATLSTTHKVATIQHRLIAIHSAHVSAGLVGNGMPSPVMAPIVKRTMQGIRRTLGVAQRRVGAIVKEDLIQTLVLSDQLAPMRAARDKALLLVGFAGAFRRSELVALTVDDLTFNEAGASIFLKCSKTDQESEGAYKFIPYATGSRCPVKALQDWIKVSAAQGAIFRAVSRYDRVSSKPLTGQSVALIVKQSIGRLHGEAASANVSGHSLRAGYCTEAAQAGLHAWQIKMQTGHKSDDTLAKYIRSTKLQKIPSLL